MSKKEFIQQFVIHASGPMFTLTNYRGERIFNEGKIIDIAESFAEKLCDDAIKRDYILLDELTKELVYCRTCIKEAIDELNYTSNWKRIHGDIQCADDHIKKIAEILHIELP